MGYNRDVVSGLQVVIAPVSNMARSVEFYAGVLGLSAIVQSEYWTSFDLGGAQLGLHPGMEPGAGFVVCLRTDDLNAARHRLEAAGVACGADHSTPHGTLFDFCDPDGNRLQLMQRSGAQP